jgi:myo-inositol 2-dehydrogenase/D-chiro-inositol 1-dehydrogenase
MTTSEPLRVLLVGAGRMGDAHLLALDSSPSAVATVVVDPVPAVRDRMLAKGLAAFTTIEQALECDGFDAALIAAPSDLHLPLVRTLIGHRLPVLCEKPCGLQSSDAIEAAQLAASADVLLQVGYWRRFVPELCQIRYRFAAGEFGEAALVQAWQWDRSPPPASFRRRSGGIVRDMGVHEIDMIRWLVGQELTVVNTIESSVVSVKPVTDDVESAAISFALSGGGVGLVSLGRHFVQGDSCWVEIIGTKGALRSEFMMGRSSDAVLRDALVAQIEAFVGSVRGGPHTGADAQDAVAALVAAEQASAWTSTTNAGEG